MRRSNVLGVGATALLIALSGSGALAGTVTAPIVDYNAAQVLAAGGVVTVPLGSTVANAVYTVSPGPGLPQFSNFVVTLPSGFLFQSLPTPTIFTAGAPDNDVVVDVIAGGIGANSVTFQFSAGAFGVPGSSTIVFPAFSVSGATALESRYGGDPLPMSFEALNHDAAPVSVPVFAHALGSVPEIVTPGIGAIDLTSSPPGTAFIADGDTVAGSGLVAVFTVKTEHTDPLNGNAPVLGPTGLVNSLDPADTVNVTVAGNFTGIAAAYAGPAAGACATGVAAGAFTGTVGSGSLSFTGVPLDTPLQICMIPDGTTLLQPGTTPYVVTYGAGSSTDFFTGLPQSTPYNFYTYTGGTVQAVSSFFTGADAGYASLLRVNNAGTGTAQLVAEFQPWSAGPTLVGDLGSLEGKSGAIFSVAQLEAAVPGLSLANSGQRATLTIIGSGANTNVNASSILVSPGGAINNVD